ncbi:hypothetical protein [Sphingomonas nostoxanthinifaciens]|uniref:hypothetical protein n=1 Tax=Sphingomonas nostoxanthinifaciens TaxID=2872652 RepID=UPI001CC1E085|nr:hypothetical protein [Sphingomonas nostoxanthinifaciens]UAK24751.1 hypothetical protein K8P63_00560 [Sphingomonas nostoxanthinifaciens]
MLLVLSPVAASAARLCHDVRGLYTPCPEAVGRDRARKRAGATPAAPARIAAVAPPVRALPDRPTKPPLFATGHLCRDNKGLATPCTR